MYETTIYEPATTEAADAALALGAGGIIAFIMASFLVILLLAIGIYVLVSIGLMRIFKKAGVPGFIAWVPIYNSWKMFEIGGQKGWWILLAGVPIVNFYAIYVMIMALHNINLKLGAGAGHTVLAILATPIWAIIMGFGKSTWNESAGKPSLAELAPQQLNQTPVENPAMSQPAYSQAQQPQGFEQQTIQQPAQQQQPQPEIATQLTPQYPQQQQQAQPQPQPQYYQQPQASDYQQSQPQAPGYQQAQPQVPGYQQEGVPNPQDNTPIV